MAKERDLNIELLRVVCMIFVILFHVNLNVILRNPATSDFLNYCAIAGNALVAVAVDCFVLISGFYGIKWKTRSFLGLFFQTEFYSVVILSLAILIFDYKFIIPSGLLPFFPKGLWFVHVYALLYLISPLLNRIIEKEQLHKCCILALLSCSFVMHYWGGYEGYNILNFILLYFLGRWIKKYPVNLRTPTIVIVMMISVVFTFIANMIGVNIGMPIATKFFWAYCSPQILLSSVLLLMLFTRFSIKDNYFIKFLAAGSFSVYLVHENGLIHDYIYIQPLRKLESFVNYDIVFILCVLLYVALLYMVIVTFDLLRQKLQSVFLDMFERNGYYRKISNEIRNRFK